MRHAARRGEMTGLELTVNRRCAKLHLFLAKSRWAVYVNFMAMHQVLSVNTALESTVDHIHNSCVRRRFDGDWY